MGVSTIRKAQDFTIGSISKPLLMFAIPLLAGNLLQQMYSITDSIIVGRLLGSGALAAIGAASPVTRLTISLTIGSSLGISVVISQFFGAHDNENVKKSVSTSYVFFMLFSLFMTIVGFAVAPAILRAMDTPVDVLPDAVAYLRVSFIGTALMVGYNVTASVYRGLGNSSIPLYMLILSTVCNIVLDLVFVVIFHMGVAGTAWATIISQGVAFVVSFMFFHKNYSEFGVKFNSISFDRKILGKVLKIGIPSGIKGSMYWLGYVLITGLVNSFGTSAIAAFSTASKIDSFVQTPMTALSSSLSTYVAQNVGAGKADRIRKGVRTCIALGIIFAVVVTTVVFFCAEMLMALFTEDAEIIANGADYMRTVSLLYIIFVLQEVPQGVAIGCGDTLWLLLSTICAMWLVRLPLSYVLSASIGLQGIWYSMPTGWIVAMIFCGGYYVSGYWKRKVRKS